MSRHIVFVRFFPGYTASFPYVRFAGLRDDAIPGVAEELRKEWWDNAANRQRTEASRAETRQRIAEMFEKRRKWLEGGSLCPNGDETQFAAAPAMEVYEPGEVPEGEASFGEVAHLAGWGGPLEEMEEGLEWTHGISGRYPLEWYGSREQADAAASALRARLVELARAAELRGDDTWPEQMNPRLDVVAEADLSPGEAIHSREQVRRIRTPATGTMTAEESLLRCLLDVAILPVLVQIVEMPNGALNKAPQTDAPAADSGCDDVGKPVDPAAAGRAIDSTAWAPEQDTLPTARGASTQEGDVEGGNGKVRRIAQGVRQRPESQRKKVIVARLQTLREECKPWKGEEGITKTINKEFKTEFKESTLQRYLREANNDPGEGG